MTGFLTTKELKLQAQGLSRDIGAVINHDRDAGTMVVFDGPAIILRALQKGRGGPWIVRYFNGIRVQWK